MPDTGQRIVADCRLFPSERSCQFTIAADKSEEEELLEVAVYHAVTHHGHQDSPQLREELKRLLSAE